jgi:hypothetical protein
VRADRIQGTPALAYPNRASLRELLAFTTTCDVTPPLFCQSVLQSHTMSARCCRGFWCAMVLALHLGAHLSLTKSETDSLPTTTLSIATCLYRSSWNTYQVGGI